MFLDSNVVLHFHLNVGKEGEASKRLYARIFKGEQNVVISPIVLDEVVYHLMQRKGIDYALSAWANTCKIPHLRIAPIDEAVVAHVPDFIRQGLEPHDAFHAAVMKANGISVICSYDKDFDKIKGVKRQEPK